MDLEMNILGTRVKDKYDNPCKMLLLRKGHRRQWEPFVRRVAAGESPKAVLDDLGLDKYCCRRMLISRVEIIDEVLKFYEKHETIE